MTTTNLDGFPLVIVTFPPQADAAAIDRFIEGQRTVLARRALHVNLFDASAIQNMPDAACRKRLVEFTKDNVALSTRYNVASVLVVKSSIVRAAITAIHWLAPPPSPTYLVATYAEALALCKRLLGERGLTAQSSIAS